MKQLTCEMCGSTDLIKQDGVFVCETCGTKYSVEEAKKMMVEGTVEVAGTVKIDDSAKIANYYTIAERVLVTRAIRKKRRIIVIKLLRLNRIIIKRGC